MNLPNRISMSRIFLIPVMILFYLLDPIVPYGILISLGVFIIASITDMVDGHIARSRNLVTTLGKLLDSIADKLLNVCALILVLLGGSLPFIWAVIVGCIIISRELLISIFRQLAATKGFVMAADWWGKIKAIIQDVAIPLMFLLCQIYAYDGMGMSKQLILAIKIVTYVFVGVATVLTIVSAANYMIKNRRLFSEDKPEQKVETEEVKVEVETKQEAKPAAKKSTTTKTATKKTTTTKKSK